MPGRVRFDELNKATRARVKIAGPGARVVPLLSPPGPVSSTPERQALLRCHRCGQVSTSEAGAERHADAEHHTRFTCDLT
jgi:hypothetical protein